jgi:hypothetical protein
LDAYQRSYDPKTLSFRPKSGFETHTPPQARAAWRTDAWQPLSHNAATAAQHGGGQLQLFAAP